MESEVESMTEEGVLKRMVPETGSRVLGDMVLGTVLYF